MCDILVSGPSIKSGDVKGRKIGAAEVAPLLRTGLYVPSWGLGVVWDIGISGSASIRNINSCSGVGGKGFNRRNLWGLFRESEKM